MNRNITRTILAILVLMEISFLFLTYMSFQNKDVDEIKKVSKVDNKKFAIYKENDEGIYEEMDVDKFPAGYMLDAEKSACIDSKGNSISGILKYENDEIIVTSNKTTFCYLYFRLPDITVSVNTDGVEVPSSLGYTKSVNCGSTGSATYDTKYNRLIFSDVRVPSKCTLTYTKDTKAYETLINTVENAAVTNGDAFYVIPTVTLKKEEYGTPIEFYSSSPTSTSGTEEKFFTVGDNYFHSYPDFMYSGKYHHIKFAVPEGGKYQICYRISKGSTGNRLYAFTNTTNIKLGGSTYISASTTMEKTGCHELGELDTSDYIKVTQRAYGTRATVHIQIYKVLEEQNAGYRYEGKNPNNYIWYNNEVWRIIGSVPTKQLDGTTKNLVKIIRNASIGGIAYDAQLSGTEIWGNNTLYRILNTYYYGKKNGTGEDGCSGFANSKPINCDYTEKGILPTSDYGKMVENVYWNTGYSDYHYIPGESYMSELENQTVSGYIGLMNASDYGYATPSSYHKYVLYLYELNHEIFGGFNSLEVTNKNWLYTGMDEWTSNKFYLGHDPVNVTGNGGVNRFEAYCGFTVRPIVYLNNSVYVISGDGTEGNPYQVAMN